MEANFSKHDKMIRRAIETSTSVSTNDPDNLQRDIDQLNNEIDALAEVARTKEIEWNNILYLKKMKEDILSRLNRKKTVLEIMSTKSIDNPENLFINNNFEDMNLIDAKKSGANTITPFIMSRCNMKTIDLAKEKANLNELHRLVLKCTYSYHMLTNLFIFMSLHQIISFFFFGFNAPQLVHYF